MRILVFCAAIFWLAGEVGWWFQPGDFVSPPTEIVDLGWRYFYGGCCLLAGRQS